MNNTDVATTGGIVLGYGGVFMAAPDLATNLEFVVAYAAVSAVGLVTRVVTRYLERK